MRREPADLEDLFRRYYTTARPDTHTRPERGWRAEVARVDLRSRRKSLVGYAVGLGLYTLVIVALYPAFKDSTSLDKILKESPSIAALFGISGSITSPDGWTNANLYANFLPLIVLLLTIGYGAAAVAGEEEAGRLDLIVSLPLSRRRIIAEKSAVMLLQAGSVCVVTYGACSSDVPSIYGSMRGISPPQHLASCCSESASGSSPSRSVPRAANVDPRSGSPPHSHAAAYLLSSLGPVVSWLDNWRVLSPFYWAIGNNQLNRGLGWDGLLVLGGITTAAITAAVISFERHDLRG